ncbi:HigA family addiction module antitoxin [Desulfonema magnum]|uniref:Antitoxin HigA n=1 Tax=Desulfonema magnum TaxID=45655 RepID=A0A975GNY9_9BACT|nr:HigA family addiction module antitoxin [Desulfonema magnum]QTA88275.1 Antitoxin HigA [Desulfonema magnum]
MMMHSPPHPGKILKSLCFDPLGLSVAEAAEALGINSETLSDLLDGHIAVTPEMAIRLSAAFDTTAESWMNQQAQYDLWQAEQRMGKVKVRKLFPLRLAELS